MPDIRLTKLETIFTAVETNENIIYTDLLANEGSTSAEIAARIAISEVLVRLVLEVMVGNVVVVQGQDFSGTNRYWTAGAWAILIKDNRAAVRAHFEANDNGLISDMATALAIPQAIARTLVNYMSSQKFMKTTRVP